MKRKKIRFSHMKCSMKVERDNWLKVMRVSHLSLSVEQLAVYLQTTPEDIALCENDETFITRERAFAIMYLVNLSQIEKFASLRSIQVLIDLQMPLFEAALKAQIRSKTKIKAQKKGKK